MIFSTRFTEGASFYFIGALVKLGGWRLDKSAQIWRTETFLVGLAGCLGISEEGELAVIIAHGIGASVHVHAMPYWRSLGVTHALVPNVYVQGQFVSRSEPKNTARAIFMQGVLAEPFD